MFNASIIPVLAICVGFFQAETKLDLFSGDLNVGYGTYKESTDRQGHRTSRFQIRSREDSGSKTEVVLVKVIDGQGFPIREEETITLQEGKKRTERVLVVRYDESGAAHLTEQRGKTRFSERIYMPIPGYSRADASDLWFSKTRPLPGTTVTSTVFDIEHSRWRVVETTYIGKRWIVVGGRQVEAHEVRDIRDGNTRKLYLDDRGQPVLMKNGQMRTEKHF